MMKRIVVAVACVLVAAPPAAVAQDRPKCYGVEATIVGTGRDDLIIGTKGRDVIAALGGRDTINSGGGRDFVCAGDGNDVIKAGTGDDLVNSGPGSDEVDGGSDDDLTLGSAGDDLLTDSGRGDSDTMVGGGGADRLEDGQHLFGGPGSDALRGREEAPDLLVGGPDSDHLDGRGGGDAVSYEFAPGSVTVDLASLSSDGSEGMDYIVGVAHVTGSRFDDTISGTDAANRLDGGDGNDRLAGGAGGDTLEGGRGNDELDGGDGADTADYSASPSGVSVDLAQGEGSGDGVDTLAAIEDLEGSVFADMLAGNDSGNVLDGSHGDDELQGRDGNDFLAFGDGDAGPGEDECMNSGAANCERHLIADPGPGSWITSPDVSATVPAAGLNRIAGRASGGLATLPSDGVYTSLRLMTSLGCRWYHGPSGTLARRSCGDDVWNRVDYSGNENAGTWTLTVSSELPPGTYRACTGVQLGDGLVCRGSFFGPNPVPFALTP